MQSVKLLKGDCLELMKDIPDESVDMILCDLPYGTTRNKWDTAIPFDKLWKQYKRIIKDHGAICLFGQEPFSSSLRVSNLKMFRYDWIWEKPKASGFLLAKKRPLSAHEVVSVFYKKMPTYNPQFTEGKPYVREFKKGQQGSQSESYNRVPNPLKTRKSDGKRYPRSVQKFTTSEFDDFHGSHPTQKPVALLEYLIKTYTNENETVLDNCMGSGSTGVAAVNLNRDFIGYELEQDYFDIATKRINEARQEKSYKDV